MREFWGRFHFFFFFFFEFFFFLIYTGGAFNETIIPVALVGYEMIIAVYNLISIVN